MNKNFLLFILGACFVVNAYAMESQESEEFIMSPEVKYLNNEAWQKA